MKFEVHKFTTAVVNQYRGDEAEERFMLILGPVNKGMLELYGPAEYRYLNLETGEVAEFHRASYLAEGAVRL